MSQCGECKETLERQGKKLNIRYCTVESQDTSPFHTYLCQRCRTRYRELGFKIKLVM